MVWYGVHAVGHYCAAMDSVEDSSREERSIALNMDSVPPDNSSREERSTALNADTAGNHAERARGQRLLYENVTKSIIDAFYTVYNKLGFGFLESVYCDALVYELEKRGHRVAREFLVPVFYDGRAIARYRIDLVVDNVVVVELKSTEVLHPSDRRQLLNCLKATPLEVGLLVHFGPSPKFYRLVASKEFRRG